MRELYRRLCATQQAAGFTIALGFWAFVSPNAKADDDPALRMLWAKSDYVLQIKVTELRGGDVEEIGVEEWVAKCEIITRFKQAVPLKQAVHIRFQYVQPRPSDKSKRKSDGPQPPHFELLKFIRGREYVVFLHGENGGVRLDSDTELQITYMLTDRWLGVQPTDDFLQGRLMQYGKEKPPFIVEKP